METHPKLLNLSFTLIILPLSLSPPLSLSLPLSCSFSLSFFIYASLSLSLSLSHTDTPPHPHTHTHTPSFMSHCCISWLRQVQGSEGPIQIHLYLRNPAIHHGCKVLASAAANVPGQWCARTETPHVL